MRTSWKMDFGDFELDTLKLIRRDLMRYGHLRAYKLLVADLVAHIKEREAN